MTAAPSLPEVDQAFREAWNRLEQAGIDSARMDARLLLGHVLGGGAERVLAEKGRTLTPDEAQAFERLLSRRLSREPISYILGRREFWSLDFKVTPATLTPRPDTETLVEAVLEHASVPVADVLDLGTGSGCIVLALLSEWRDARGVGVDASADALAVARENAASLAQSGSILADHARFVLADWTEPDWARDVGGPFDVVVSNPPYIPAGDMDGLDEDVRGFEPLTALVGGLDGLDAYRAIVKNVQGMVRSNGILAFEVGIGQADDVASILASAGYNVLEKRKDLAGIARVVVARNEMPNEMAN